MLETPAPSAPTPSQDPARTEQLRRQLTAIATLVLDSVLSGVEPADGSTGSTQERLLARVIQPWLPKLRTIFLYRLSAADGPTLERLMGATATAIESMLYYAPGDPLPRWLFRFTEDGGVVLEPAPEPPAE